MPDPSPEQQERAMTLNRERHLEGVLQRATERSALAGAPNAPRKELASEGGNAGLRPLQRPPATLPAASTPDDRLRALEQQRGAALVADRAEARLGRMRAQMRGGGAKAAAAKAVQSLGIIKQSHFFYGIAFLLAVIGDILDFFTVSLPVFDFITGLLLLTLVYPYIADPTLRLTVYLVSLLDFIPLVGFIPFWTLATGYAWYKWAREQKERRNEPAAARQPEAPAGAENIGVQRTERSWVYSGAENAS
ncbi:MAG: hypothetical protein U1A16_02275 [Patescibacteria group bacterium]|nr:hypothetical protein [Patescibacteria group bacterium]